MEASKISVLPSPEVHRQVARVHLELLDQFISLTKHARDQSTDEFLRASLDDQIEWLSDQKSTY